MNRPPGRSLERLTWVALSLALAVSGGCERREPGFAPTACLPPISRAGRIIELDPALRTIVPPDYDIQKLATGFVFIEGPVWVDRDPPYLLFTEVRRNEIYQWTPDGTLKVFLNPAFQGRTGPTGLTLDPKGRLVVCEHGNRRISRIEHDGKHVVLADRYQGKRLNSPNDAVYKSDGWLYFTDPPYGLPKQDLDPANELEFNGLFRLGPEGAVELLDRTQCRPNGIAFSPDEKVLYVANSDPRSRVVFAYDIPAEGAPGKPRVLRDFTDDPAEGSPDGLKVDREGNVYVAGPGGVCVLSRDGRLLGRIQLPESASNMAWGGPDGKTLYVTAQTSLYRVSLNIRGAP